MHQDEFAREPSTVQYLIPSFRAWCRILWPSLQSGVINRSRGYFNHHQFLQGNPQPDAFQRDLHKFFVKFLVDINLSFSHNEQDKPIEYNMEAQKNAFLRFAQGLETMAERSVSSLHGTMADLKI